MIINIATDFSKRPGGRFTSEGPYSGQLFRDTILLPKFKECQERGELLQVILDGGYGYGSSFLEEAFGGLAYHTKDKAVLKIGIVSTEEPRLVSDIMQYMKDGLDGNFQKNR